MEAERRSKQRADLRSSPQDHSGRQSDLQQITGEERYEPDVNRLPEVSGQKGKVRDAAEVDDRHAQQTADENACDSRIPSSPQPCHCRGRRKCHQVSAGRSENVDESGRPPGEHGEAHNAERKVEHERRGTCTCPEQATDDQDGQRLQA